MLPEQRSVADETIRVADRWYVLATSSRTDDRTRVLKDGDMFAVFDRFGDVHPIGTGELGIYYEGTRFLSYFDLRLNGRRPMLLNSSVKQDNSLLTVDLTLQTVSQFVPSSPLTANDPLLGVGVPARFTCSSTGRRQTSRRAPAI